MIEKERKESRDIMRLNLQFVRPGGSEQKRRKKTSKTKTS